MEERKRMVFSSIGRTLLAIGLAFLVSASFAFAAGANPLEALYWLVISPFTKQRDIIMVLVEAQPLILVGLGVLLAFRARYFNLGSEGQLWAGAVAATWVGVRFGSLPSLVLVPSCLLVGAIAGGGCSLVCRMLRSRIDEAISTLLLNRVIFYLVLTLLSGPWQDPSSKWPRSVEIALSARLPIVAERTGLTWGIPLAIFLAIVFFWVLRNTTWGLETKALGMNAVAAKQAGIDERRLITQVALVSGAMAGLAGAIEVCGKWYRLVAELASNYGLMGVIATSLGNFDPLGTILGSSLLASMKIGAPRMQWWTQTPAALGGVMQALVLLGTVAFQEWRFSRRRNNQEEKDA